MADNLTVTIGIDTAKLRADAAIVKEELRKVNQQVTAAAKAGDAQGVRTFAAEQDRLVRSYGALNQQIRVNTVVKQQNTLATKEAAATSGELVKKFGELAHASGLPIPGLRAMRLGIVGLAAAEVVRGVTYIADRLNGITNAAKESGVTVQFLKGLQDAFVEAGDSADKAGPMMANFNKVLRESRQNPVFDPKGAFESLGIGSSLAYEQTLEGTQRAARDAARAILELKRVGKIDDANTASIKAFNFELAVIERQLQKLATGTLRQFPAPTAAELAAMEEYNKSVAGLAIAWDQLLTALAGSGVIKEISNFIVELSQGIEQSIDQVKALVWWIKALGSFYGLSKMPEGQPDLTAFEQRDFGGGSDTPGGASGGFVRGPGSGTSDSILARLSNGEFVINAGAVQRLGTGFLNGLNSFRDGGLIDMHPIRFAEGGLASAAGGGRAMASFHFENGQSFRLGGPPDIVNGLVRAANEQQMKSAGVKPSWFAGRPSGR